MTNTGVVHKALQTSPVFSVCEAEKIVYTLESFEKGSRAPNTPGGEKAVGLVVTGCVRAYSVCVDGTSINLSSLKPGDSFGISNLFSEDDMATLLICDVKTTVAYLSKDTFMALLTAYPEMLSRYARLCNDKINFLIQKIALLTTPSCAARLAGYLLKNRTGTDFVMLESPKERLARILGVSRASLFREFRKLSDRGLIAAEGRKVRIIDPHALEKLLRGEPA